MKEALRKAAQAQAAAILEKFKVKHPRLVETLAEKILSCGPDVEIRLKWDSSVQDLDFEVVQ